MAKLVEGPMLATMVECVPGWVGRAPIGEQGVLEIYESQRKKPGQKFAVFYYTPGRAMRSFDDAFETAKYFATAPHPMQSEGDVRTFMEDDGVSVFEVVSGEARIQVDLYGESL